MTLQVQTLGGASPATGPTVLVEGSNYSGRWSKFLVLEQRVACAV
jgi:hypothetical protein